MGDAHGVWTRISVVRIVAGKPEGGSPLRGTGCSGKNNIKTDLKKEKETTFNSLKWLRARILVK
jgi:hypothetical protein